MRMLFLLLLVLVTVSARHFRDTFELRPPSFDFRPPSRRPSGPGALPAPPSAHEASASADASKKRAGSRRRVRRKSRPPAPEEALRAPPSAHEASASADASKKRPVSRRRVRAKSRPPAPEEDDGAKRTWAQLSRPVVENTKRVGMEFELRWVKGAFKPTITQGITQEWGDQNGHLPFYKGDRDWAKWEVHLDGAICPEMVLLPVDADGLATELKRFKDAFHGMKTQEKWKKWVQQRDQARDFVRTPGYPDSVYDHFQKFTVSIGSVKNHPLGKGMPQVTSTYTLGEMMGGRCEMAEVVYDAIFKNSKTDEDVRTLLYQTPYHHDAKLTQSVLIKTLAEQMGPDGKPVNFNNPPKPPNFPAEGIDKVKEEYGLHTKANKVTNMFTRGGHPAYLVEIRKHEGFPLWFDDLIAWVNSKGDNDEQLRSIIQSAFGS